MLIYVLEDSPTQLVALMDALSADDVRVRGFKSLNEIEVALAQVTPCVIVADFHITPPGEPWGTSLPLCTRPVPVVVVTLDFDAKLKALLLDKGAADVIDKHDYPAIVATVRRVAASR